MPASVIIVFTHLFFRPLSLIMLSSHSLSFAFAMSGMQPLLCAPVQLGHAPNIPTTIVGNTKQRAPSPLSDDADCENKPKKTARRKNRRTLRFPCKARGVTKNHTANNAFVDVPPRAKHGAVLICSHPVCAASGRKFRYCSVCARPVAKRNFSKRHSHGLLQGSPSPVPTSSVEKEHDTALAKKTKRPSLASMDSVEETLLFAMDQDDQQYELPKTVVIDTAPSASIAEVSTGSVDESASRSGSLTAQEREWLALFHNRPIKTFNETEVRTWMNALLKTADIKTDAMSHQSMMMETRDETNTIQQEEDDYEEDSSILELLMDTDFLGDWSGE